jgi:hypothetical protein
VSTEKFSVIEHQTVGSYLQAQLDNFNDDNQDDDYHMMELQPNQIPDRFQQAAMEEVVFELHEIELDKQNLENLEKDIMCVQPRLDNFFKFPHVNVLVSKFINFNLLMCKYYSLIQPRDDDHDLVKMLKTRHNERPIFTAPADSSEPFDRANLTGPTKGEAAHSFHLMTERERVTSSQKNGFLKWMASNTSTSINNFVHVPKGADLDDGKIVSALGDYVEPDYKDITIDVCPIGCMAFMGTRMYRGKLVDCAELIYCLDCSAKRFSPCSHNDCKALGCTYDQCNLYAKQDDLSVKKRHKTRTALQTVFYRSTISKLVQLYCLSLTTGNANLLKYNEIRRNREGMIQDICDGSHVKLHQGIMKDRFLEAKRAFEEANPGLVLFECSLGLTFFYDGGMNFKRSVDSMWPLLTSVVNCNPSDRTKLGLGCHLSSLHNLSGSGVEKFLLSLYTKELKALENGLLCVIDNGSTSKDHHFYLQARMLYMHADTKAVEKITYSKGSGSFMCTACTQLKGVYNPALSKVGYPNMRDSVSVKHLSRFIGEKTFEAKTFVNLVGKEKASYVATNIDLTAAEHQERYYACDDTVFDVTMKMATQFELDTVTTDLRVINTAIGSGKIQYPLEIRNAPAHLRKRLETEFVASKLWYNPLFPYCKVAKHCRFPYTDSRAEVPWQHVTNEQYLADAAMGDAKDEIYQTKLAARMAAGQPQPLSKHDSSHNGRHSVSPIFAEKLESFTFLNVCFDFMHYGDNALNYFILMLKGDRSQAMSDGQRKYSAATGKIPALKYTKVLPEFQLLPKEETTVDAVMNTFLVPVHYMADYSFKYPFLHPGYLKSHNSIVMLLVYLSYCLSFTDLHENYQEFYARYAYDLECILNPCLSAERLRDEFIPNILETRIVQAGLFPESECVYVFHQLTCLVHQIELYGHIRSLQCFFGERAMGIIASFVCKGGVHYMKNLYHTYVDKENTVCLHLEKNILFYDNNDQYSDFVLKMLGKGERLVRGWDVRDAEDFFVYLMSYLVAQCIPDIWRISPFWRLYKAYKCNFAVQETPRRFEGFVSWMRQLSNLDDYGNLCVESENEVYVDFVDITTDYDEENVMGGLIYLSDFRQLKSSILNFNPVIYSKLITKGVLFNCRGHEYSRSHAHTPMEELNVRAADNLVNTWHMRKHYGSFVRCTDQVVTTAGGDLSNQMSTTSGEAIGRTVRGTRPGARRTKRTAAALDDGVTNLIIGEAIKFGQINSCWRLDMPGDVLLHGVSFANVTFRKADYIEKRRHYRVDASTIVNEVPDQKFICVNNIDSTALAVSPLNKSLHDDIVRPMLKPVGVGSFIASTDSAKLTDGAYARRNAILSELFLIELHPERKWFRYDNILSDIDGTKTWEKIV